MKGRGEKRKEGKGLEGMEGVGGEGREVKVQVQGKEGKG